MSFIANEQWLKDRLQNDANETIVMDVQFQMDEPEAGRQAYLQSHIPYASYLDLDQDLSGPPEKHEGKRPLPDVQQFAAKLGDLGVTCDKTVVIYDQVNGIFAARAWWLLHYMGHEKVYVLDGGFKRWMKAGNETTDEIVRREPGTFQPNVMTEAIVDINRVKENIKEPSATLIDSRSKARYLGQEEKMHAKAGHIPGAKNFFWKNVLNEDGTYKDEEELQQIFSTLNKEDEIIVSCGSGISACPNVLALKEAGYQHVKLYPGSFSDWISYDENELETTEE